MRACHERICAHRHNPDAGTSHQAEMACGGQFGSAVAAAGASAEGRILRVAVVYIPKINDPVRNN
jgi:hypothetical protein